MGIAKVENRHPVNVKSNLHQANNIEVNQKVVFLFEVKRCDGLEFG